MINRGSETTDAIVKRFEVLYVQPHQPMILYEISSSLVHVDFTENDLYGARVRLHTDGIVELITGNQLQSLGTAKL